MTAVVVLVLVLGRAGESGAACTGRFINPVTDICWNCIFPLTLGGISLYTAGMDDTPNPKKIIHICPREIAGVTVPLPCIPVSFWEPARMVDVTRTPWCFVNLGGLTLGPASAERMGSHAQLRDHRQSFYHVHWFVFPVMTWLELLTDFLCLEKQSFDVAWVSELDPTWNDDSLTFLKNPEAVVFANPLAQLACAADCLKASTGFPADSLFWCGGCQGSLYPFSGTISESFGGVQASQLLTMRLLGQLTRMGAVLGTSGEEALCQKTRRSVLKKTEYKSQMLYPVPQTRKGCYPLGRSDMLWSQGTEYPYQGEDFGYLLWRKRNCCIS